MPTLGDLKTRIIAETNRDDLGAGEALEDTLQSTIERACEHFSGEDFWFIREDTTATTVSGQSYVTCPYAIRIPQTVSYNDAPLRKVQLSDIEHLEDTSGQPTHWAPNGSRIQLWPIPDAAYTLDVFGEAQVDAPTADGDETIWTNEAYDLIAARVRFLLFRDVFRDVEGTQLAAQAEGEAETKIRRETRKRRQMPLRSAPGDPWTVTGTFDINTGVNR